jgi:hypothetical protein
MDDDSYKSSKGLLSPMNAKETRINRENSYQP